jgi:hypothetical protein
MYYKASMASNGEFLFAKGAKYNYASVNSDSEAID